MPIHSIILWLYEREPPPDEALWHKWNTLLMPVRCVGGGWTWGLVWRRKSLGKWEYQARDEGIDRVW